MQLFSKSRFVKVAFITAGLLLSSSLGAKTLVTVDGTAVSDTVLNELKQQNPNFNYDSLPQQQKTEILNSIIQQVLASNAAKKVGLDKSDEYRMMEISILGRLWLQNELKSIDKQVNITDDEIKKFYETNKTQFVKQNATLSHILVSKESEAKSIIDELAKTPKSKIQAKFSELAKKLSEDKASAVNGGKMENVNLGDMVPEFANGVRALKPNTYTKTPIKSMFGYHIVYLDKLDAQTNISFDDAKAQIKNGLKQQKQQQIINDKLRLMRDNAKIVYGS